VRSNLFKRLTVRCIKTAWALFATVVVTLAVVVSLFKFALPYADDYKTDIETYLYERFGAKVEIGSIGASWQTSGPVIVLNDVRLSPTRAAPLDISIKETRVDLNFWQSIAEQKLVTGTFLLDGIRSRIDSSVFFKVRPQSEGNQLFESLSHLFLSQVQQFKVVDSFIIVNHEDGTTQDFQIDTLTWVNQGNRHQGQGEVFVDGFSNNSLAVIVDLYGQRRDDIFGQIYLEANKMDVTPWLTQVVGQHIELSETEANFSVWGEVQGGLVENILLDIRESGVFWKKQDQTKYLKIDSATVQWWKSPNDWLLFGNHVRLRTDRNIPDPFAFSFMQGQDEGVLTLNKVDITAVSQLFSLFSATKELAILAESDVSGLVDELQISWGPELDIAGKLLVSDFAFLPKEEANTAYLGLKEMQMEAFWLKDKLWLNVNGSDGQLATADTFSETIGYQNLQLNGLIDWSNSQFQIKLPKIELTNNEINLKLAASYLAGETPHLDLYGEVKGPTQGNINKYLPKHLINAETYDYLNKAIQQGRGETTQVLLSGDPKKMPYSEIEQTAQFGRFIVHADIEDALFRFDPDWPALDELSATLTVDNSTMIIAAESGQFGKLTLSNDVVATIPLDTETTDLYLGITPDNLELSQFHDLIDHSPLEDILGEVFDFVRLEGTSRATVNITVPLDDTLDEYGREREILAEGRVITNAANLSLPEISLDFTQVESEVWFKNEAFSVVAKEAKLFDLPVRLNVSGGQTVSGYELDGELTADWSKKQIADLYPLPIMKYANGDSNSSVKLKVNIGEGDYQYFVDGKTDLTDVEYDITHPIRSTIGEYSSLGWSLVGDQDSNVLAANLDDYVHFAGEIPSGEGRMSKAHLRIGDDNITLLNKGFDISVNAKEMEFEPTLGFVLDIIDSLPESDSSESGIIDVPSAIRGTIEQVNILGQNWHNVSLDAKPEGDHWLFSVGAKETLTQVKVFDDIDSKGIQINSEFLQIYVESEEENGEKEKGPDLMNSDRLIRSLPAISMVCNNCTYNQKPLGRVELETKTEGNTLVIEKASAAYDRNRFEGVGKWYGNAQSGSTEVNGELTSRYFGRLLKDWGLDSGIKDSNAEIKLQLSWLGAPQDFNLEYLNGTSEIKLGEGYLSEIDDQGLRYISIFSLDSLYRKLKFDFKDVFSKGLFYNDIKGSLLIKDGVVHSDNIRMDGVAGDMEMKGHTDLNNNTLDYNVSFKPKVTSSLPAIAAWFAPADGGLTLLAAIALDKIIENAPVVSEIKLKITGDLSEPDVQEVERFTRTVKLPEIKPKTTTQPKTPETPPATSNPIEGSGQ